MNKHSTWHIIAKNTFTLFNLVNLILAAMVLFVGSPKNALFLGVAIANTLISIINELRAKKIVDNLRLLSEKNPTIMKNGQPVEVPLEEIKEGDRLRLTLGDQIMFDSKLVSGSLEVNESFITGEQDNVAKNEGDKLISGSFVVSGTAEAVVEHIGADNFVTKLQSEASNIKTADSKLFKLMNNIVKYISWALIPIGVLLLWSRFRTEPDSATAVTSTVAALINMIPEGLILLTSSVLALATVRLSRRKILVQDLYAIETLARVDCICLDKTGTLTTGKMSVKDILLPDGTPLNLKNPTTPTEKRALEALAAILSHQTSENATTTALKAKLARGPKFKATSDFSKKQGSTQKSPSGEFANITEVIPFSSDRKYSGIRTKKAAYLMGAIDFLSVDAKTVKMVKSVSGTYRVLAVVEQSESSSPQHCAGADSQNYSVSGSSHGTVIPAQSRRIRCDFDDREPSTLRDATSGCSKLLAIIRLEDEIRPSAPKIINYFYQNDIAVKIISGDDLAAVTEIATKVGVKNPKGINLSDEKHPNYSKLVKEYNIFTRVKPEQKKFLVKALRAAGKTVAMTGDGVNDILAMKEADVSLAIGEGADAARRAAKFVLLDSGYEAVPNIIDEGRQSINNLERSTTLFLAKTVYASILAVLFVFLPFSYPFSPIEMSLLNFVCIGLPGVILALEKNTERIKNKFTTNIIEYSVPIGFTVSAAMLTLSILSHHNNFTHFELTTTSVFITFAIDLILIYWVSRPLNLLRTSLIFAVLGIMAAAFFIPFARDFFEFTFLTENGLIIMVSIIAASVALFFLLRHLAKKLSRKFLPSAS